MLQSGATVTDIVQTLHVSTLTVQRTRKAIGMPAHLRGRWSESLAEAFAVRTEPAPGGHVRWTGCVSNKGMPVVSYLRTKVSAYRVAFRAHYGRDPVGLPKPGCGYPRCVAGAHLEDQPMRVRNRETFAAIFGSEVAR
jgi:hypothetical protein